MISKSQKIDLPENFWNDDEWSKKFQYQIVLVNRLLKKYSPHAILKTLRDKRCWSVYSFGIFLHKNYFNHKMILDMFQKEIEYEQNRKIEFTPSRSIVQKPRIKSGKKNILSLLKEVDNE